LPLEVQREEVAPDLFAETKEADDGQYGERGAIQTEPIGDA
jgi:hypothetical protein